MNFALPYARAIADRSAVSSDQLEEGEADRVELSGWRDILKIPSAAA
jgi:hypothetical protein